MRLECWQTLTAELAAVRLMVGELDFRLATNDFSSTWDQNSWTKMKANSYKWCPVQITDSAEKEQASIMTCLWNQDRNYKLSDCFINDFQVN